MCDPESMCSKACQSSRVSQDFLLSMSEYLVSFRTHIIECGSVYVNPSDRIQGRFKSCAGSNKSIRLEIAQ